MFDCICPVYISSVQLHMLLQILPLAIFCMHPQGQKKPSEEKQYILLVFEMQMLAITLVSVRGTVFGQFFKRLQMQLL